MTMTLERALDVLRVVTSRAMQGSETRDAYDCVVSHLTQTAQSVDIGAIREVIESHINEAKKLRHDPESQDYLYEQAEKLEAAIKVVAP